MRKGYLGLSPATSVTVDLCDRYDLLARCVEGPKELLDSTVIAFPIKLLERAPFGPGCCALQTHTFSPQRFSDDLMTSTMT